MPPRRVARAKQPDKHISDDVKAVEDDKHEELPADEAGFAGLTPSPNKVIPSHQQSLLSIIFCRANAL